VGEKYGVTALYPDADALFRDLIPDIAAVVTPSKYYKDAVIAAAEAGVKGVSTDKPVAATLSDADAMVDACASRGVILSGGALVRAIPEVQEAAGWIREGRFGEMTGAAVLNWSGEISGSGCHTISVLRLLTGAEVEEVISWGAPEDILAGDCDWGLTVNGRFKLSNGIDCPVFGKSIERGMVDVWNDETLVRMAWGPPEIYTGVDENGARIKTDPQYTKYDWGENRHLRGAIRALLAAVETGDESRLWISGHDLRQALEVAIASHQSAQRGSVAIKLPLEDRSLTLYPRPYRWLGGDFYDTTGVKVTGRRKDMEV
jgi:predicted dehydrogenase